MIMLCLGLRPAPFLRTRRPRPSEKTAFHLIPGLSPQGHPSLDGPPLEGRAPHARDVGITPSEMSPPFGHRPLSNSSVIMACLGLRPARIRGRGDRVPPRKSSFAPSPAFPSKAIPAWMAHPAEGRLRTPANETLPPPGDRRIRPPGFRLPPMVMLCLGLRPARICGRGDRAPPRKPPFT
jgi:hypothetical protein